MRELPRIANKPSLEEILERIKSREPVNGLETTADLIREDRDSR
jgi:hypothetical protein